MARLTAFFGSLAFKLIAIGFVLLLVALLVTQCDKRRTAETKAKVGTEQRDAAIDSGTDAVDTIGANSAREGQIEKEVGNAHGKIRAAPNAGAADNAARSGLCDVDPDYCE